MLRRLWHRALVGCDAEDGHVDTSRRRHHGAEEALVAGHVDHARHADAGQFQVGISGFESDAAPLLLGQPVGVDAGERLHQRGLAVVDVAGGADHHPQRRAHSSTQKMPGASFFRSSAGSPRRTATGAAQ